jgi:hypothetical protein
MDDRNLDVLQNLELAVVEVWRTHPNMTDYVAQRAYEAAFEWYRAEVRGHLPKPPSLSGLDQVTFNALKEMCELRLGRGRGESLLGAAQSLPAVPVPLLVDCLRELRRSVERHTRLEGRQGYLKFIDGFLP